MTMRWSTQMSSMIRHAHEFLLESDNAMEEQAVRSPWTTMAHLLSRRASMPGNYLR
jgi:hypothetical protein